MEDGNIVYVHDKESCESKEKLLNVLEMLETRTGNR